MSRKKQGQSERDVSEALDHEIAEALVDRVPARGPASILLVADKSRMRQRTVELLEQAGHHCICIGRLDTARATIARGRFDLILIDPELPDGNGLQLATEARQSMPTAQTILLIRGDIVTYALEALRAGVANIITPHTTDDEIASITERALKQARNDRQRDERIVSLKKICKELNIARHEISDQVDVLCKDLVNAYQDMAEQISEVAMTSEFKTLLKQELDVEDLLRTALQFLLTKTGPTNAAVFLPDTDQNYGLGAYVNYDCPRESITVLLDHLCFSICPQMAMETDIITFADAREFC